MVCVEYGKAEKTAVLYDEVYNLSEGTKKYVDIFGEEIFKTNRNIDPSIYFHKHRQLETDVVTDSNTIAFFDLYSNTEFVWHVYDLKEKRLKYILSLKQSDLTQYQKVHYSIHPSQIFEEDLLILEVYLEMLNEYGQRYRGVATYFYDIKTSQMQCVGSYKYNAVLSPDKKYLAYTSPHGDEWDIVTNNNNLEAMGYGFYIEELETKNTVYYPIDYPHNLINGWIKI